jgi:CheY-like chemotaxis protein
MPKVLVVEDDADTREALARALQRRGYQTASSENGHTALAEMSRDRPDLIVLDLRMPVMDGMTFLQVIRGYLRWRDLPVIVVTAVADAIERESVLRAGALRVFQKANYNVGELVSCVDQILRPNVN